MHMIAPEGERNATIGEHDRCSDDVGQTWEKRKREMKSRKWRGKTMQSKRRRKKTET
jgi:hypothetical protein